MVTHMIQRSFRIVILLGLLLACGVTDVRSESWPRKERSTYLRLGLRGFDSDGYFNAAGNRIAVHRLQAWTYSLYSEYSYSRHVSAIVDIPAYRKLMVQERPDGELNVVEAPGDINLGLRIAVFPGASNALYARGVFSIPIGETSNINGLWSGDDEYDQLLTLGYMHRFDVAEMTFAMEGGYHFRTDGYSDELVFAADASVRPMTALELAVHARLVRSQKNGKEGFIGGQYGFAANNQEFLAIGPELTFWLSHGFGLNAAVYSYPLAKNLSSAVTFSTGIVFLFHPMSEH